VLAILEGLPAGGGGGRCTGLERVALGCPRRGLLLSFCKRICCRAVHVDFLYGTEQGEV
jgi:hypothetical protein